ncbi:MAG: T9SS type A sorting domain-containing protein [Bacteroidota bacterium]|nr:T9SS type A sorting domain-containing protein [Bacteroidota bacterium]
MKSQISFVLFIVAQIFWQAQLAKAQIIFTDEDWHVVESSNFKRIESANVLVRDKIYVFSGFTAYFPPTDEVDEHLVITPSAEIFDPILVGSEDGPWSEIASMPIPVTHTMAITIKEEIWIIGGFVGNSPGTSTDSVQIYNTLTNTWAFGPNLPEPMASHGTARVGNKIYAIGGLMPDRMTDNDAHYFIDLGQIEKGWQNASPFPKARNHFGVTTLKGKIYVIGGQYGHDEVWTDLPYVHVYDPVMDDWEELKELPTNRSHFEPGTLTIDGKIIIVGGRNQDENSIFENILLYNPVEDIWQELDQLPKRMLAPVAKFTNNKLFVSHGGNTWREPDSTAYVKGYILGNRDILGFWPNDIDIISEPDKNMDTSTLLWTQSFATVYKIDTANLPHWIRLDSGDVSDFTDYQSKNINLFINTEGLLPGSYSHTIMATAPEYADAELKVNVTVPQTQNEPITSVEDIYIFKPSLLLYPNPTSGETTYLELKGLEGDAHILIRCFNSLGRTVFERTEVTEKNGEGNYEIKDFAILNSGIYSLEVISKDVRLKSRLIKR